MGRRILSCKIWILSISQDLTCNCLINVESFSQLIYRKTFVETNLLKSRIICLQELLKCFRIVLCPFRAHHPEVRYKNTSLGIARNSLTSKSKQHVLPRRPNPCCVQFLASKRRHDVLRG